ncbi:MAG: GGDEF domain-containing protein [Sphaerochaetaceae bacterium]|nr:GGDEF domain-containing protein [Sphaerochaetaceae bacterium]
MKSRKAVLTIEIVIATCGIILIALVLLCWGHKIPDSLIRIFAVLLLVLFGVILYIVKNTQDMNKELIISETDILTGLPKYKSFQHTVQYIVSRNPMRDYIIGMSNLKNFKSYNYTYGSVEGDKILQEIGSFLIRTNLEYPEVMVAAGYYGNDNFIACWDVSKIKLDKIYNKFCDNLKVYYPKFDFAPLIGFSRIDKRTNDIGLACDNAAIALSSLADAPFLKYRVYDESMGQKMVKEARITNTMYKALENNEFIPYLQPQFDYKTNTIIGAEVLVRWKRGDGVVIPPSDFIPTFENTGFIFEMDSYMWEVACKLLRGWKEVGLSIPYLSVNVSRKDIFHDNFVSTLVELVEKYGINPNQLHLEVTESAYTQNPIHMVTTLTELKAHGFIIEMDDFGSGYSSLNALREMPVDVLKMDAGFLSKRDWGLRGGKIITSVIRMASIIGIPVIAEGVETKEDADFLKSVGCSFMQGYYFSKPMSVIEFEEILKEKDLIKAKEEESTQIAETVDFFNANVQSTMLFNSFVGGAAIIDFGLDNKVSALRINDRFFEILNLTRDYYKKRQYDIVAGLSKDTAKAFLKMLKTAEETGKEASCITCSPNIDGKGREFWGECTVRFLSKREDLKLFYLTIQDITEKVNLEKHNKRLNSEIVEREDLFKHAADQLNLFYWKYNIKTKEMHSCYRCQEELGLDAHMINYPEPAIEKCVFPVDQAEACRKLMKRVDAGEDNVEGDFLLTEKHLPFKIRYTIERDENGIPIWAYGTAFPSNLVQ